MSISTLERGRAGGRVPVSATIVWTGPREPAGQRWEQLDAGGLTMPPLGC